MDGILNLYKPSGYTSHDAVARLRRFCGTRRIGHAGTLDPMAEGVLPILVGRAAAAQEYLMNHRKRYLAGMRFGTVTDTGDVTGTVLSHTESVPTAAEVKRAAESFVGKIEQIPPMYSAVKIDGKRLYALARAGKEVERTPRTVEIFSLVVLGAESGTDYLVRVECGKGTYIRTLCEDIGARLGCGGTLYRLTREACGCFEERDAVSLSEVEETYLSGGTAAVETLLKPVETVFLQQKPLFLPAFYARLCRNGCAVALKKLSAGKEFLPDETVRLYDDAGVFFALGKIGVYDGVPAVKAAARFAD